MPTDIGAIAEEAVGNAQRAGARITLSREGAVIAPVRAGAVKRALSNLIDNAVAHGEDVRVTAAREARAVTVTVEDDGPGIAEDQHEDAFRPFSRLDETRTKNAKGVGLGLSIARDVARAHGGEITLSKSALGGLMATLRLPLPSAS